MATRFWSRIRIGGTIAPEDVERFARTADVLSSSIGQYRDDSGVFTKEDDAALDGRFGSLEKLCAELNLSFIRESDGCGEQTPEIVFWIPHMPEPYRAVTDALGDLVVPMDLLIRVRDAFLSDDMPEVIWLLDRHIAELPDLPPFELDSA